MSQDKEREALLLQTVEALRNYVDVIAKAGGGDKMLFMAAMREADDKARAALAAIGPQDFGDLTGVQPCCGDYVNCHRACTPRGRWQATKDREDALASQQAGKGEPVADVVRNAEPPYSGVRWLVKPLPVGTRLYASPPQVDEKPVAWRSAEQYSPDVGSWYEYYDEFRSISPTDGLTPLFASPPSREPLTELLIEAEFGSDSNESYPDFLAGVRFAERAHGIHSREGEKA